MLKQIRPHKLLGKTVALRLVHVGGGGCTLILLVRGCTAIDPSND